jgi:transposase
METKRRPRMDFAAERARRLRAGPLFAAGLLPAEVARRLQVSRQAACTWFATWKRDGRAGLVGAGRTGRPRKLATDRRRELKAMLERGARAAGFDSDLWTLERIAQAIRRAFHVRYHPSHVWRLLGELNWSCQRPARRARERDEPAIRRWLKHDWPRIKKQRSNAAHC